MDYTKQPLAFRAKKAARYMALYGPRRTLAKVRAQFHMKKRYKVLPPMSSDKQSGAHVGIIGCGNFAFSAIAYYLQRDHGRVIRGAMDIDIHRAASLFEAYGLSYYTDDAERLISDPAIDLVFIASNHASHAEYAVRALAAGKSVHIEKPHVVSEQQLHRLCEAMTRSPGRVNLGFNRPGSRFGREIRRYLWQESGAAMMNWFVAGHEIPPDHWYFKEEEGGRVLGNLCHWTDFVYQMTPPEGRYPLTVTPTRAEKSDADIAVTYTFGHGSIAVITFSAKGHTFEGVRERFAAHRGNVLIAMEDFKHLQVEVVDRKKRISLLWRDHGHQQTIRDSYAMVRSRGRLNPGVSAQYVFETGELFLKTKEALENRAIIRLHSAARAAASRM